MRQIHRNCPLCGADNAALPPLPYSRDDWHLKACRQCGMAYLENAPDYASLSVEFAFEKTHVEEAARRDRKRPLERRISAAAKWVRARVMRRNTMLSLVRKWAPPGGGVVVDLGCGWGGLLAVMPPQLRPVGIEISAELARTAAQNLARREGGGRIIHADSCTGLGQLLAEGVQAQVVLMSSYLEHEIEPLAVLRATAAVLADAGVCIIKVPNFGSWNLRRKGADWCGFRFPDHVNYFTPRSLTALVEMAGLEMAQFNPIDRNPISDNMWCVARKAAPRNPK